MLVGVNAGTLVDAIIEDGLAFSHAGIEPWTSAVLRDRRLTPRRRGVPGDPPGALEGSREALREGEKGLLSRLSRWLPREPMLKPGRFLRVALHAEVMEYLFADAWTLGPRLNAPEMRAGRRGAGRPT